MRQRGLSLSARAIFDGSRVARGVAIVATVIATAAVVLVASFVAVALSLN
jgi:hypothetical protein